MEGLILRKLSDRDVEVVPIPSMNVTNRGGSTRRLWVRKLGMKTLGGWRIISSEIWQANDPSPAQRGRLIAYTSCWPRWHGSMSRRLKTRLAGIWTLVPEAFMRWNCWRRNCGYGIAFIAKDIVDSLTAVISLNCNEVSSLESGR